MVLGRFAKQGSEESPKGFSKRKSLENAPSVVFDKLEWEIHAPALTHPNKNNQCTIPFRLNDPSKFIIKIFLRYLIYKECIQKL